MDFVGVITTGLHGYAMYEPEAISFATLFQPDTQHYLAYIDEDKYHVIDLSSMILTKSVFFSAANWQEIFNNVTDNELYGYKVDDVFIPWDLYKVEDGKLLRVPIPNVPRTKPMARLLKLGTNDDFKIDYGTILDPTFRNIKSLKHNLHEVIISKQSAGNDTDFNTTIPIVNGKLFNYKVFEDEMYVLDANLVTKTIPEGSVGVQLLDFSELGELKRYSISDIEVSEYGDNKVAYTLPEATDEDSIFFVFKGRLIDMNRMVRLSTKSVSIHFDQLNIPGTFLSDAIKYDEQVFNTNNTIIVDVNETVRTLLQQGSHDTFFFTVGRRNVAIREMGYLLKIVDGFIYLNGYVDDTLSEMEGTEQELLDMTREFISNEELKDGLLYSVPGGDIIEYIVTPRDSSIDVMIGDRGHMFYLDYDKESGKLYGTRGMEGYDLLEDKTDIMQDRMKFITIEVVI